jgi:uncharacterized membrane protein
MLKKSFLLRFVLPFLLIILIAFPAFKDLLGPGYYTSHDGEGHVIRMDEFYRAFTDGQFPVRWSKRLYFGYGYPFFNFNYPSVYYFGLPVMLLGFSATSAMKVETIVMFVLSGVFMYLYLRRKVSFPLAIAGATLYLYAPYRLLNIYVRGSVGESAAFVFAPLLLWAGEAITHNQKKSILWGSLIIFLLGISHNISALLLFAFFFGYSIFHSIAQKSPAPFLRSVLAFVLGIMMAAFFFVPALTEKSITFLDQTIARDYPAHFIYPVQFIKSGWDFGSSVPGLNDGLSFNLGYMQMILAGVGMLMALFLLRRKVLVIEDKDVLVSFIFNIVVLGGSIFFMLPLSKFLWDTLPLLPFVQFPWRFIMLTVPALTVIGVIGLAEIFKKLKVPKLGHVTMSVIIILACLYFAKDQWRINQPLFPRTVPGDALEGSTTWADEQATRWFTPKPSKIPAQKIQTAPLAAVNVTEWKTQRHRYTITATEPTTIVENTMYYPGWEVRINGQAQEIHYQDAQYPGRIVFSVPSGTHEVTSRMMETPLRQAMNLLSLGTLTIVVLLILKPVNASPKNKKRA